MQKALIDVDRAIKTITNLPEGSEKPETKVIVPYEQIGLVLLSGDVPEKELKVIAKDIKQKLLDEGLDKVDIDGLRKQVIYVDVDPVTMFANKLDINDINTEIFTNLKSIPSGVFRDDKLVQLRTSGTNDTIGKIKKIVLNTPYTKQEIKLQDLAKSMRFQKKMRVLVLVMVFLL